MTIDDQDVIDRFNKTVHDQLEKARKLPNAVQGWNCDCCDHGQETFQLAGNKLQVHMTHDEKGWHRMQFAGDGLKAYELIVDKDGLLRVEFAGEEADRPNHDEMIEKALDQVFVMPNSSVLYGWKEDAVVTMLMSIKFYLDEDTGSFVCGTSNYVLKGHELPARLQMDGDNIPAWIEAVWDQICALKLVQMGDRVNSLENGVFWKRQPGKLCEVFFTKSDHRTPRFAYATPYVEWHPREKYPGEIWPPTDSLEPLVVPLAGRFK